MLAPDLSSIQSLPPAQDAWCWLSRGAFVSVPQDEDAAGLAFRRQVAAQIRAGAPEEGSLRGVLRRLPSGELALLTRTEPPEAARLYATICQQPGGEAMPSLTLIRMEGASLKESARAENLSAQSALLADLPDGEVGVFFLAFGGSLRVPRLLVGASSDAIKPQARALRSELPAEVTTLRGRLRRSSKGGFDLRSQGGDAEVLAAVVRWVSAHQGSWPALRALHGSRLTVLDDDGEIRSRHQDPAAWDALR